MRLPAFLARVPRPETDRQPPLTRLTLWVPFAGRHATRSYLARVDRRRFWPPWRGPDRTS